MTVEKLIEMLQKIEDKQAHVEVAISQYNKRYPVAYCDIHNPTYNRLQNNGKSHRIEISLPHNDKSFMYTVTKKL